MNKTIGIVIGLVVVAGIGVFVFSGNGTGNNKAVENKIEEAQTANVNAVKTEPEQEGAESKASKEGSAAAGSYESYDASKVARAESGKVVLFFHASWCPTCRALNGDIEKNLSAIPGGTTILKTDYDKETELKKKYGVTYQHTLVQVDKDGNMIKKWSGGLKLENLLSQVD